MLMELGAVWLWRSPTLADAPLAKELSISQVKITGDEFIILGNATSSNLPLGNYWLQYFNDFNLANSGISNSSAQLPSVTLQPGQEILLAAGTAANCGQVWVSKLSFSLKDSAGLLQVLGVSQTSGIIGYKPQDQGSWSSKEAGTWKSTSSPPGCSASGTTSSPSTNTPAALTRSDTSPPSVVLGANTASNLESSIPASDIGLASPQISELLPNPAPPQTDAADEFIELYNPNAAPFDLSGFILRTGTSTTHDFKFPAGQFILQPHEFRAFYAPQTGLNLANSGGMATLLDPSGNVLVASDVYASAKDDYAWVYADNLWQWTTTPTPDAVNAITVPPAGKSTSKASTTKSKTAVKGQNTANGSLASSNGSKSSKLHPLILAGVGALALLYAGYEYRHDLANQLYRFRRHRVVRQTTGQVIEPTNSRRAAL